MVQSQIPYISVVQWSLFHGCQITKIFILKKMRWKLFKSRCTLNINIINNVHYSKNKANFFKFYIPKKLNQFSEVEIFLPKIWGNFLTLAMAALLRFNVYLKLQMETHKIFIVGRSLKMSFVSLFDKKCWQCLILKTKWKSEN